MEPVPLPLGHEGSVAVSIAGVPRLGHEVLVYLACSGDDFRAACWHIWLGLCEVLVAERVFLRLRVGLGVDGDLSDSKRCT
ncbi:hypothetical protein [Salinibacter phage 8_2]